jgi:WS/DGAT/MGAT family acyltransferase
MQRLTGLDATFLYMETPHNLMHVASVCVFDPSTVPGGYSFEKVRKLVGERLPLLPPFRRRLVEIPFQLHHPLWIEDPAFDLDYHLRRAALPSPGGLEELATFAGEVFSRPLDRDRPLWEMYVLEGLADGRIAAVTKTHHAAIDGVSGAELTVNLLDLEPQPAPPPETDPWKPDRVPTDLELVTFALQSLARQPLAALKTIRRTLETAITLRRRNRKPDVIPPPGFFDAPKSFLNQPITPHRRIAFAQVPLEEIKQIKRLAGATVNDVVLAVCSGALRRYLAHHGEEPDESLVALVPVSVRTEDQKGTMGNKVSGMLVSLETVVEDPVERLQAITGAAGRAKDQDKAIGADVLMDWAEFMAPALANRAARLLSSTVVTDRMRPLFNVTISNVPGPPFPLYSAGSKMEAIYPLGPITDGMSLNITVMSYLDTVFFGVVGCREVSPDLDLLSHWLHESADELLKAAGRQQGSELEAAPTAGNA